MKTITKVSGKQLNSKLIVEISAKRIPGLGITQNGLKTDAANASMFQKFLDENQRFIKTEVTELFISEADCSAKWIKRMAYLSEWPGSNVIKSIPNGIEVAFYVTVPSIETAKWV